MATAAYASEQVPHRRRRAILSLRGRYVVSLLVAIAWTTFSTIIAQPWLEDLGNLTHPILAFLVVSFIAFIPGFMNAFLLTSVLLDRRNERVRYEHYPPVSVVIAAYNEAKCIEHTVKCLMQMYYPGDVEILVVDDGSVDSTSEMAKDAAVRHRLPRSTEIKFLRHEQNRGKSAALNTGIAEAKHDLIVTIDGDCCVRSDAVRQIVERYLGDPDDTVAVAGCILVQNPEETLLAAAQQWDYFHGIAAVKRMQSMYHGTLVAQGAFSLYRRDALEEIGSFPECIGEDIVITWGLLKQGHRIGYAEDAICYTNVPEGFRAFALQRRRWARGMVEALERHQGLLFKPRMTTIFHWWNLLFLPLDFAFTLFFLPGLVLAAFGIFWIAGPMTLAILPLAALWQVIIYSRQKSMLRSEGLQLNGQWLGFIFYALVYPVIVQPVSIWGYLSELIGTKKTWGTR